jgi:hypothetical protein
MWQFKNMQIGKCANMQMVSLQYYLVYFFVNKEAVPQKAGATTLASAFRRINCISLLNFYYAID